MGGSLGLRSTPSRRVKHLVPPRSSEALPAQPEAAAGGWDGTLWSPACTHDRCRRVGSGGALGLARAHAHTTTSTHLLGIAAPQLHFELQLCRQLLLLLGCHVLLLLLGVVRVQRRRKLLCTVRRRNRGGRGAAAGVLAVGTAHQQGSLEKRGRRPAILPIPCRMLLQSWRDTGRHECMCSCRWGHAIPGAANVAQVPAQGWGSARWALSLCTAINSSMMLASHTQKRNLAPPPTTAHPPLQLQKGGKRRHVAANTSQRSCRSVRGLAATAPPQKRRKGSELPLPAIAGQSGRKQERLQRGGGSRRCAAAPAGVGCRHCCLLQMLQERCVLLLLWI